MKHEYKEAARRAGGQRGRGPGGRRRVLTQSGSEPRRKSTETAIDASPMADPDDQNPETILEQFVDGAIVAYAKAINTR
jgi:hypothetical protein